MTSQSRTDELGRAFAGSQLQVQIYVARRQAELSTSILDALSRSGAAFQIVQWVAPLERSGFAEPIDAAFLDALDLGHLRFQLEAFWPRGGPHWDALARLEPGRGVLLVEGKSYPDEVLGPGCQATEPARTRIVEALAETRRWFGATADADWLGPLYQFANRLAHVRFLREAGYAAWLANLCFIEDPRTPTTEAEWRETLPALKRQLGFTAGNVPHTVDVFLPARIRSELIGAT